MKDYLKEIETIADEIDEIRSYIKDLNDEKLELYRTYGTVLFSSVHLKHFENCDNYEELLTAYDVFRSIRNKIQDLESEIDDKIEEIDILAEKYRSECKNRDRRVTCGVIDICNLLEKEGYLVGIKL